MASAAPAASRKTAASLTARSSDWASSTAA
jgi:hypothetical protein